MGMHSALKAAVIAENVTTVLGIELMCAAQAIDLRRPLVSTPALEAVHSGYREVVASLGEDRVLHPDIIASATFVRDGLVIRCAESTGLMVN